MLPIGAPKANAAQKPRTADLQRAHVLGFSGSPRMELPPKAEPRTAAAPKPHDREPRRTLLPRHLIRQPG
jgi:hypothetical protein